MTPGEKPVTVLPLKVTAVATPSVVVAVVVTKVGAAVRAAEGITNNPVLPPVPTESAVYGSQNPPVAPPEELELPPLEELELLDDAPPLLLLLLEDELLLAPLDEDELDAPDEELLELLAPPDDEEDDDDEEEEEELELEEELEVPPEDELPPELELLLSVEDVTASDPQAASALANSASPASRKLKVAPGDRRTIEFSLFSEIQFDMFLLLKTSETQP
jgi:hypothetical protein